MDYSGGRYYTSPNGSETKLTVKSYFQQRRSSERGLPRRGPRSPPPRSGSAVGGNGVAHNGGGRGGRRRKKGKGKGGRWKRRSGQKGGGAGGVPLMSGGNKQPIASMRMRMDDYRPPRAERLLRDPKEGQQWFYICLIKVELQRHIHTHYGKSSQK